MLKPGDAMNKPKVKNVLFWVALTEGVGLLSGLLSREGTARYGELMPQIPLAPPGWVFPVVWVVLFFLMGVSAARISAAPRSQAKSRGLNLFISQLIVNFFWSPIFFNARAYGLALVWLLLLWVLVLGMILQFWKVDKTAAALQLPYLLWLTFAAYLNWAVWRMQP